MLKVYYRDTMTALPGDPCGLLGALCFTDQLTSDVDDTLSLPTLPVMMPVLSGPQTLYETLCTDTPLTSASSGDIRYRCNDSLLFGVITLDEADFIKTADAAAASPLQMASRSAYEQIFALLETLDFPFVLRFWNYMADINGTSHNLERYRQFNLGRQQAFAAKEKERAGNVPAACALGTASGPLTIAFLAARIPSQPIENPRQVSAYDYPAQYGPRSPLFSRASVATIGASNLLFLSGTASIVGHTTLHADDVMAQTDESLTNVEAVLDETCRKTGRECTLGNLEYIVYIRQPADLSKVQAVMERRIGANVRATYLQADICRTDLLVEIEGSSKLI